MWDLIWSICCSSLIFVVFKLYKRFEIQTFYAIVVNYLTAFSVGFVLYDQPFRISAIINSPWFPGALMLGGLFIVIFNLMARTSQLLGVSVASVATKMSLAIPVVLGVWWYDEVLGPVKITGVILALVAVYFSSVKKRSGPFVMRSLYLPLLVFLGSGVIDSSLKYIETHLVARSDFPVFSAMLFASAAVIGILGILIRQPSNLVHFRPLNVLGGIALGIPNYFSIFFLLRALQTEGLNSASVFTLNNVSIVMLTTLLGIILFKEQLSWKNWMGIGMAILSILLISLY